MDEVSRPRSTSALSSRSDVDFRECDMSEEELTLSGKTMQLAHASNTYLDISVSNTNKVRPEKRARKESDEQASDDKHIDDFTLVEKKKYAKRKKNTHKSMDNIVSGNMECVEVCVTANEVLPKQICLAKLLKTENIINVTKIKYKTPYKLLIKLENKEEADKLVKSEVFKELGYRCRCTNEVSISYGVVKYIELDVTERELTEFFECETEIISIRRLKRLNAKKEWSDSETVQFCFKGAVLPQYVYGTGSRFKVEPYTFPVSQCSSCWHYGHIARFCPSKKKVCPKCSGEHENCDTTDYRCTNCRGEHVAFNRNCPRFIKEKRIRQIMCKFNCTYKVALRYLNAGDNVEVLKRQNKVAPLSTDHLLTESMTLNDGFSYKETFNDESSDSWDVRSVDTNYSKVQNMNKKKVKKQKKECDKPLYSEVTKTKKQNRVDSTKQITKQAELKEGRSERRERERNSETFNFAIVVEKLKNILLADATFEDKMTLFFKYLIEEAKVFFLRAVNSGDVVRKLINIFHNG